MKKQLVMFSLLLILLLQVVCLNTVASAEDLPTLGADTTKQETIKPETTKQENAKQETTKQEDTKQDSTNSSTESSKSSSSLNDLDDSLKKAQNSLKNTLPSESTTISDEDMKYGQETVSPFRRIAHRIIAILFSFALCWIPLTVIIDVIAGACKPLRPLVDGSKFKIQFTSSAFATLTSGEKLNFSGWLKESTITGVWLILVIVLITTGLFWTVVYSLAGLVISAAAWVISQLKGLG